MKIDNAQIDLGSRHQYSQLHEIEESLVEGINKPGTGWSAENLEHGSIQQRKESFVEFSTEARLMQLKQTIKNNPERFSPLNQQSRPTSIRLADTATIQAPEKTQGITPANEPAEISPVDDARLQLLIVMIETITGKKFDFSNLKSLNKTSDKTDASHQESLNISEIKADSAPEIQTGEYGFAYHYSETYSESEHTQFTAQGIAHTVDGQTINIALELNMSREFIIQNSIDIREGAARLKDPLIINFSGTAPQLTEEKLIFDIDADGSDDHISFIAPNSGFLALDKNQDGVINNGNELFGALSGNGFSDLAQYDEDQNNFIDENDSIYSKLRIWTQDQQGNKSLMALGKANVGAIYLAHTHTPFELKNAHNQLQGAVKSSGIYLGDDGSVGSVQQLDLTV